MKKAVGNKILKKEKVYPPKKTDEKNQDESAYVIETAISITRLKRKVGNKLNDGYILMGGMNTFSSSDKGLIFCQTMFKHTK